MSKERYEIKEKIGQGGVGAVYKAYDTQLNREVAIKRVLSDEAELEDSEATKNLLKEATALSSLQHPHIVTVYDAGIDEDGPYVVMEMIKGRTLDEMVERGTLTWEDLHEVALQTQEALIAAQDLDLVHRDLKPSNVMVCWLASGKFQVKIVDFGLAKFSAAPSLQTIDHGDAVFGSIFFMAPEQFERTPLDQRTDMYAMGCLYYYALTADYPFNGDTAAAVMASHLQHNIVHLRELRPDIPTWAADWVMWHMERNMEDRPVNARQALEQLLILDKQATQAVSVSAASSLQAVAASAPKFNFDASSSEAVGHVAAMAPTQALRATRQEGDPTTAVKILAPGANAVNPHTQAQNAINQVTAAQVTAAQVTAAQVTAAQVTGAQVVQPTVTGQVTTQPLPQITSPQDTLPDTGGVPLSTQKKSVFDRINALPKAAKISTILILSLILIVVLSIVISTSDDRNEIKDFNAVIMRAEDLEKQNKLSKGLSVSKSELNALLNKAISPEGNKKRFLLNKSLAYAKGDDFDVNSIIVNFISESAINEDMRINLLELVMENRNESESVKPLIELAANTLNDETAVAAINAAKANFSENNADQHFISFLHLINNAPSLTVLNVAESAASEIVSKSSNKEAFSATIVASYESSIDESVKHALLRLLGATGTKKAGELIMEALNSVDSELSAAAAAALSKWPNNTLFDELITYISSCDERNLRSSAFSAAIKMTPEKDGVGVYADKIESFYRTLAEAAKEGVDKILFIQKVSALNAEWAVNMVASYMGDSNDAVAKAATQAKIRMERRKSNKKR